MELNFLEKHQDRCKQERVDGYSLNILKKHWSSVAIHSLFICLNFFRRVIPAEVSRVPSFLSEWTTLDLRCFSVVLILLQTDLYDIWSNLAAWLIEPVCSMASRISMRPLAKTILFWLSTIQCLDLSLNLEIFFMGHLPWIIQIPIGHYYMTELT